MLILTRKPGETVVVGDDVRITVLAVRGSQIKLGIEAPREVRVNREEVLERESQGQTRRGGQPAVAGGTGHVADRHGGGSREPERWYGRPGTQVRRGERQPRHDSRPLPHDTRSEPRRDSRRSDAGDVSGGRGGVRPRYRRGDPQRGSEAA